MTRIERHRRGFTLIELLVVIAIIAILIGLLLPAVQKVRAAAARMSCQNNLKQLAIAVHSYHDTNNQFPTSGGPGYNYNPNSPNCWSWLVKVLPYIEQQNLYQNLNVPNGTIAGAGAWVATPIKTLQCPADGQTNQPRTDEANIGSTFNYGGPNMTVGQTNYKGVCGNNWAWGSYTNTGPTGNSNGLDAGNGIFFRSDYTRPLTMVGISDGTSNTFMIGEDVPRFNVHCDWVFFNHGTGTCAIPLNSGMRAGQPGFNNPTDWPDVYSFRSMHTGGANFAYADGGVRFVSDSIDLTTYRNLATYAGGEVVSPP